MAASFIVTSPTRGQRSGIDHFRWAIKTCADFQADQIRNERETTIGRLCALPRPDRVTSFSARFRPAEFTIYTVKAQMLFYRLEEDGDVHIVLQDPDDQSQTLIAELPDPRDLTQPSPYSTQIAELRRVFDRRWAPSSSRKDGQRVLVIARGFGFFDKRHNALGASPTGIELHPLLELRTIRP